MQIIDSHQHFWKFDPIRDGWINADMSVIQRDFLPADLQPILAKNAVEGCITVQSVQSEEENVFYLENADKWDFIKGVVGWVDLQADNIDERLQYYSQFKKMKGFRHVLQGESQRDFMLRPAFMNGLGHLHNYGFTYDLLIYADQLHYCDRLVRQLPEQPFVLDHIAKPDVKRQQNGEWQNGLEALALSENVFCKLSGMVTEADWKNWNKEDFTPYMDVVLEAFGIDRIMFGSDWPVCLVAASYEEVIGIISDYFSSFSSSEKEKIFGGNASRFYKLDE
jgi:L-fuconolactonase